MYKNNSVHRRKMNEHQYENGDSLSNGDVRLSMPSTDEEKVSNDWAMLFANHATELNCVATFLHYLNEISRCQCGGAAVSYAISGLMMTVDYFGR